MIINSFLKIVCCVSLFTAIILSVNAANSNGGATAVASSPPPTAPREDFHKILLENKALNSKNTALSNQIKSLQGQVRDLQSKDKLRGTQTIPQDILTVEIFKKEYQKPEKTDLSEVIIAIVCVGGGLGLLLLISFLVLFIRTKKEKNKLSKEDLKDFSNKQTSFTQKQEVLVNQIIQKIPSVEAISSGVIENLKGQFDSIRKAVTNQVGSKNEPEILETIKSIKALIIGELATLRSQAANVSRQQAELTQKIAAADRKVAEAQKTIENCEADKTRAVNAAKTEMQTSMLAQFSAEKAKMNEAAKQQINAAEQQTYRIEKLTTECAELRIQSAEAERRGYERGLKASQEKTDALIRDNEHLSMELNQARARIEEANAEFNQKLSLALLEKEKEFKQAQITSQNTMREAFEKKYNGEIERLRAALTEKTNSTALLVQQKNESDQKVRELQEQVSQTENEIANEQKKAQAAEAHAHESVKKMEAMQAAVLKVEKEKESLEGTIVSCKTSIEKLTKGKEEKEASLHAAEEKISELQSVIYPSEYVKDHDFSILKEHLDGWFAEKISAAEIIKSALGLFSQKAVVNPETWQQALRNISVGITQVMREKKQSPDATLAELVLWSKFLMKFSDENYDFALKIPNIGDNVDPSWMSTKNAKITKVNNVLTWAVWNNQFGVMHNAEVE